MRARRGYVWLSMLIPIGVTDLVGAVRASWALHWTQAAARAEAEEWACEMGIGPVTWQRIDGGLLIGHVSNPHLRLTVRSLRLPQEPTPR